MESKTTVRWLDTGFSHPAQPAPPLVVISAHLDDGVLGCGRLLAAHPGSVLITLFAGGRADWSKPTEWDRMCGYRPGEDVAAARRYEDAAAARLLGATPYWLDIPESTYRSEPVATVAVAESIANLVRELQPGHLVIPIGLHHPDHLAAAEIAFRVVPLVSPIPWLAYSDFYHVDQPELVAPRLAEIRAAGWDLRPTLLPLGPIRAKRKAIRSYRSQARGLGSRVDRWASKSPEILWEPSSQMVASGFPSSGH